VPLEIFEDTVWQMSLGERAAVEGVLAQLRPPLAIEVGSAQGACLRRIAAHAREVHSFDLEAPRLPMPPNVTLHTGDSHELLPRLLFELSEQERNVDFVVVDGDHSPSGVRQDLEDLLDATALARTVILIHDIANERVRSGVDAVRFEAWPKVAHVELDWVPGRLFAAPALRNELWFGLGLVILDSSRRAYANGSIYERRYHPSAALLSRVRDLVVEREQAAPGTDGVGEERARVTEREVRLRAARAEEAAELAAARTSEAALQARVITLQHRIAGAERALAAIKGSVSWRMTEPLRAAKRRAAPRGKR